MAISAVSSAGSSQLRLFRSHASEGPAEARAPNRLDRVRPTPELAGREDAQPEPAPHEAPGGARKDGAALIAASHPVLDPRRPESLLKPSGNEVRSRLDELRGERSAIEGRQAAEKGARSAEVMSVISQLKARDGEVRAHEAAHIAAGGRYVTGGASYSYQKGPDGAQYAVGGEVGIDTSPIPGRPEETAQKMRTVRAAALAPSEPSGADLSVAAAASAAEADAYAEMARMRADEAAKPSAGAGPRDIAERVGGTGQAEAAGRYGKEASAQGASAQVASAQMAGALRYDAEPPRNPVDVIA